MNESSAATLNVIAGNVLDMSTELRRAENMLPADRIAFRRQLREDFDKLILTIESREITAPASVQQFKDIAIKFQALILSVL